MDIEALPKLLKILKLNYIVAIREVVFAIVFICFYNSNVYDKESINDLVSCFNTCIGDDIILS